MLHCPLCLPTKDMATVLSTWGSTAGFSVSRISIYLWLCQTVAWYEKPSERYRRSVSSVIFTYVALQYKRLVIIIKFI